MARKATLKNLPPLRVFQYVENKILNARPSFHWPNDARKAINEIKEDYLHEVKDEGLIIEALEAFIQKHTTAPSQFIGGLRNTFRVERNRQQTDPQGSKASVSLSSIAKVHLNSLAKEADMSLSDTVMLMKAPSKPVEGLDEALRDLLEATITLASIQDIEDKDIREPEESRIMEMLEYSQVIRLIEDDYHNTTGDRFDAYVSLGYNVLSQFKSQLRLYQRSYQDSPLSQCVI